MSSLNYFIPLFIFVALTTSVEAFSGAGAGTSLSPYQITTCVQLQEMENALGASYQLQNHIECLGSATWNPGPPDIPFTGFDPIGIANSPFNGTFNGQNFEIRDLFIERADDSGGFSIGLDEEYVGLFGFAENATLQNVVLVNTYVKGYQFVGGLVGFMLRGTINNVKVNEAVVVDVGNDCDPKRCIWARHGVSGGGIVGAASSTAVTNVVVGGAVKGSGTIIGGIAGLSSASTYNYATSTARVDGGEDIGGLIGRMIGGSLTNAVATGNVVGVSDIGKIGDKIGGAIGFASDDAEILNVNASGDVTGKNRIGGLIGYLDASGVNNGQASGAVSGEDFIGGIVGESLGDSVFDNSRASGAVSGTGSVIGGFAGSLDNSRVEDSFALGNVSGQFRIGGFVGEISCGTRIDRSYASGNVSGTSYVGGFGNSSACGGSGPNILNQLFASGSATATSENAGGFLGGGDETIITDAYAVGNAAGNELVGGFVGFSINSTSTNVYARGAVTSPGLSVGGLVGSVNSNFTVVNSFWDTNASGQPTSPFGIGLATGPLNTLTTFTNASWDFTTIWGINEINNNRYPFLRAIQNFVHGATTPPPVVAEAPRSSSGGGSRPKSTTQVVEAVTTIPSSSNSAGSIAASVRELVLKNRSLFEAATKAGITLPTLITDILASGNATTAITTAVIPVRDLFRGMSGEDVRALQVLLINHNTGPKALELKRVTATGFFINYTEEALIEYQTKYGIVPATGYFGPASRAQIKAVGLPGLWW
jgi:hypothetical protein